MGQFSVEKTECILRVCIIELASQRIILYFSRIFSGPPADHWALVSGLPTYVAENGFVSLSLRKIGIKSITAVLSNGVT